MPAPRTAAPGAIVAPSQSGQTQSSWHHCKFKGASARLDDRRRFRKLRKGGRPDHADRWASVYAILTTLTQDLVAADTGAEGAFVSSRLATCCTYGGGLPNFGKAITASYPFMNFRGASLRWGTLSFALLQDNEAASLGAVEVEHLAWDLGHRPWKPKLEELPPHSLHVSIRLGSTNERACSYHLTTLLSQQPDVSLLSGHNCYARFRHVLFHIS